MRFLLLVVGWLQAAAGLAIEYLGYRNRYIHREYGNATGLMTESVLSLGLDWLTFLFCTPLGWLSLWLLGEGLLRVLSSGMDQPFSTLPIVLYRFARKHARRRPPPPPRDILRREGDAIVIDSARDYGWDSLATIEIDGARYTVEYEPPEPPPTRAFRYRLTPIAPNHVIRVVTRYAIENSDASKP